MATIKGEVASASSLATTELNSLANNARVLSGEYDNGSNLYLWGDFELAVGFGTAPTVDTVVSLYLVATVDGTNYEAGDATDAARGQTFIGNLPVLGTTSLKRYTLKNIKLPLCKFKILVWNRTGQAFASSSNTLKMLPSRYQTV